MRARSMQGSKIARLRDVAEGAQVSLATVSRYLNRSLVLPPGTAARIDGVIRELGYRANPHARRLSLGRSESVGLVIPDVFNPFFAQLADAVEQAADDHGLDLLLCATRNRPEREHDYLGRLRRTLVDGLIFITNHPDDGTLADAVNAGRNVVLMDEDIPGATTPRVFADNEQGGYLAGSHLVTAGHRRLAFVGGPRGMLTTVERLAGFRRAVQDGGPHCSVLAEYFGDYTAAHGRTVAPDLASCGATGVFVASDEIALGVLEVFAARGVGVPEAVSLVAFDDVGPLHLLHPPLTAVAQPIAEMGRCGLEVLLTRMKTAAAAPLPVRLPVRLVSRGSVGPPTRRRRRGGNA